MDICGTLHPDRDRPGERAPTPCAGPGGRRHPLHVGDPAALSAPRQEPGRPFARLYLKGISTGDFGEALAALLGSSAPGLSASTITRLKEVWGVEAERWQRRDLTAKRYVYFWVDGIYFSARMEEEKQCILVIVRTRDRRN